MNKQIRYVMKSTHILALIVAALFLSGCASKQVSSTDEASATGASEGLEQKTSYDGSTGSALLMERYISGSIEGFQD